MFLNNLTQALEALSKSVLGSGTAGAQGRSANTTTSCIKQGRSEYAYVNKLFSPFLAAVELVCSWGLPRFFREAHSLEGIESTACPLKAVPKEANFSGTLGYRNEKSRGLAVVVMFSM